MFWIVYGIQIVSDVLYVDVHWMSNVIPAKENSIAKMILSSKRGGEKIDF